MMLLISTPLFASEPFSLSSKAIKGKQEIGFDSGLKSMGKIDSIYAAKDKGDANLTSFPFSWKSIPKNTKFLALVFDDPDAKKIMEAYGMKGEAFIHWLVADINPSLKQLKANASLDKHDFIQGKNGMGTIGYIGPQPPSDFPADAIKPIIHVYRLTVYALSDSTGLKDGFTFDELQNAMKDKILGQSQIFMSYNN